MSTDIRVGDVIKATSKDDPVDTASGRVSSVGLRSILTKQFYLELSRWDIEVLERPLPKVEDDLMEKAIDLFRKAEGWDTPVDGFNRTRYTRSLTPVINAVREYDRSKESK